jgi:hypothetical protein
MHEACGLQVHNPNDQKSENQSIILIFTAIASYWISHIFQFLSLKSSCQLPKYLEICRARDSTSSGLYLRCDAGSPKDGADQFPEIQSLFCYPANQKVTHFSYGKKVLYHADKSRPLEPARCVGPAASHLSPLASVPSMFRSLSCSLAFRCPDDKLNALLIFPVL